MCDIYNLECAEGHRWVSMHNGDYILPRNVIKEVYCPECEPPHGHYLIYKENGWAIEYNKDVIVAEVAGNEEDFGFDEPIEKYIEGQEGEMLVAIALGYEGWASFNGNPEDESHPCKPEESE